MNGDYSRFVIDSFKCPLNLVPGMITTPKIFMDILTGNESDERVLPLLSWCDMCGRCSSRTHSFISKFYIKNKEYYRSYFRNHIDKKFELRDHGDYYIYVGEYYKSIPQSIMYLIKYLKALDQNIGLITGPDPGVIYFLHRLGYRFEEELNKLISRNNINFIITLDKYIHYILQGNNDLRGVKVVSIASFINILLESEDFILRKSPEIKVHILNSPYKYYIEELKIYRDIARIIPSIKFYISRRLFGSGLLDIVADENIPKYFIKVVESTLSKKIRILAVVDPRLYSLLYYFGERKDYIYTYLPNLLLGFMSKI